MSANTDDYGLLRTVLPPDQVNRFFDFCDRHGWALLAVGAVIGALPPLIGLETGYLMTVVTEMYLFAILALSWDLVGGQTGYPSFGNMAFFGFGAYTTAILTEEFAITFPVAFVAAGLVATLFALAIGIIVLRLRGHYFAIATLGVLLAAQQVSRNLGITGGTSGKILLETPSGAAFYYLFLAVLVVQAAVIYYLSGTRFGFVLNAIRDDEGKATAMGFNTTYYKTTAWALSGLFTGLAGGMYSHFNTFIDPQTAYNGAWNIEMIVMALLGGSGTVAGPILGAFGLHTVVELVESYFVGWQLVLLGITVIVTVILLQKGIVGSLREYADELTYYERGGMAARETSVDADTRPDDADSSGGEPR